MIWGGKVMTYTTEEYRVAFSKHLEKINKDTDLNHRKAEARKNLAGAGLLTGRGTVRKNIVNR